MERLVFGCIPGAQREQACSVVPGLRSCGTICVPDDAPCGLRDSGAPYWPPSYSSVRPPYGAASRTPYWPPAQYTAPGGWEIERRRWEEMRASVDRCEVMRASRM